MVNCILASNAIAIGVLEAGGSHERSLLHKLLGFFGYHHVGNFWYKM